MLITEEPVLVAAELTWALGSGKTGKYPKEAVKKARKFAKKLEFLKHRFGKWPLSFCLFSRLARRNWSTVRR